MIGKMIKYMRESSNMTQSDLASELEIGQTTLSGYERGFSKPNYEMVERVADICDFEIVFIDKNSSEIFDTNGVMNKSIEVIKKKDKQ